MPPAVTKVRANNGPVPKAPPPAPFRAEPGSVLSKAIPAGDIRDTFVKMLLYGPSGTGKTHLAATFEKPLLLLALERTPSGGARTVRRFPGVTVLRPGAPTFEDPIEPAAFCEEMTRLVDEVRNKNPFKTVVIDHVTALEDYVLEKIVGRPLPTGPGYNTVSGDHYRDRAEAVKQMLRPWLDLPCHAVMIGKEKDHNPPKDERVGRSGKLQPDLRPKFIRGLQAESCVGVKLGGGAADWLHDNSEYICRLYMDREMRTEVTDVNGEKSSVSYETGKFVRALRVGYHPNYLARFRSDFPERLPEAIVEPTWNKIMAAIEGRYEE